MEGMLTNDILPLLIVVLLVVIIMLLLSAGLAYLRAKRPREGGEEYCDFPNCISIRRQMRALVEKYPNGIPAELILALVDGIERHEHHRK